MVLGCVTAFLFLNLNHFKSNMLIHAYVYITLFNMLNPAMPVQ